MIAVPIGPRVQRYATAAAPALSGPFLYYPGSRLVPAPLRAFIDFVKTSAKR
ncbi:hypothetical protein [Sorangium sp. So ce1335]|uniref:hypothetical protein n=1 Tax=Sorangium sp. So ce1335 TaxID=3133335 RepID=UPI003F5DC4BE